VAALGRLFAVTSWLVALLAAGLASQAAALLAKVDLIPNWGFEIWDTSWLLDENSIAGRALRALIGYSDRPMGVQLAAYVAVLATLMIGARLIHRTPAGVTRPKEA
jgi:high-affinity iron transporter